MHIKWIKYSDKLNSTKLSLLNFTILSKAEIVEKSAIIKSAIASILISAEKEFD
ncbi:hypothetical protein HDV01_004291, partial [Terramyces sp. JEL0728]